MKVNLKNILKLTPQFWLKVGELASNWVKTDALAGIMQNNTSGHAYRSREYMKYKANRMERFTDKTYKKGTKRISPGTTTKKGTKLEAFRSVSIASNDVSKVNMTLTGRTLNALAPKVSDETSVTMSFKGIDPRLLLGNQRLGYDIIGLNDKNKAKVLGLIEKKLDENIKKEIKGKIVINIGK